MVGLLVPAKSWIWGMIKLIHIYIYTYACIYIYIQEKQWDYMWFLKHAEQNKNTCTSLDCPNRPFSPSHSIPQQFQSHITWEMQGWSYRTKLNSWVSLREKKTWQDVCLLSILGLFNTCGSQLHPAMTVVLQGKVFRRRQLEDLRSHGRNGVPLMGAWKDTEDTLCFSLPRKKWVKHPKI